MSSTPSINVPMSGIGKNSMDVNAFNERYPRHLRRLIDRAMFVVHDGITHTYNTQGRNLRLIAYYDTVDLRGAVELLTVVMHPVQTERSLARILLSAFTLKQAKVVRKVWREPLYEAVDGVSPSDSVALTRVPILRWKLKLPEGEDDPSKVDPEDIKRVPVFI